MSVRYRHHGDEAHPFSEALGVVASVTHDPVAGETVTILTRRGANVPIPVADVLAAKVFPIQQ